MKKTYVAIATFGSYDDKDFEILYSGQFEEEAERACKKFEFPDPENNCLWVQVWEEGNKTHNLYI